MAEYVISQLISYERRFRYANLLQEKKIWSLTEFLTYRSLNKKTIGILGLGIIGKQGLLSSYYYLRHIYRNNWIDGAILDVFQKEPLSKDSELWSMPNVIITPHVAAVADKNEVLYFELIF
ncbi:glyoxylate/hydroxypyruvate reductase A-like [Octopus sinensis]|uniref:Glyoxylate/hydroxypyruvate reductase A-like n=1 Tax=Octopus sinensis TaxID=2607531 RepID=A0A6P7TX20_9MOLL|nr:glyoxylate/hydroxypyruvate reductase A-like [Octopus sinensis]